MRQQTPASGEFRNRSEHPHQVGFRIGDRGRQRADADRLPAYIMPSTLVSRTASGRQVREPFRHAVVAHRFVQADERATYEVLDMLRLAVTLDVFTAGVDGPN